MVSFEPFGILAGFLGTLFTGTIAYFGLVRKSKPEETAIALNAWKELLAPLQAELKEANTKIELLTEEVRKWEQRHKKDTEVLRRRIKELERKDQL